jgi:hypothetical protein
MVPTANDRFQRAFHLAAGLAAQYDLSALSGLIEAARSAAAWQETPVAVLDRFKAGKSSFLNHLTGRDVLPAGVVPVTTAVTELRCGALERAFVEHTDNTVREVRLDQIAAYASEKENPETPKVSGGSSSSCPLSTAFPACDSSTPRGSKARSITTPVGLLRKNA